MDTIDILNFVQRQSSEALYRLTLSSSSSMLGRVLNRTRASIQRVIWLGGGKGWVVWDVTVFVRVAEMDGGVSQYYIASQR